ncbi:MAG TPA: PilZ domain-containing protein [Terriglobales bacterium]|jgi:hypothetical protein|nr:PilZ domain-containing protein [Terriglobales bacterium]
MSKVNFQPRQYPRVPLVTGVRVEGYRQTLHASSIQVGAGGMALENAGQLRVAEPVTLSFSLPGGPHVTVHGVVWWKREKLLGVRFDPNDDNRHQIQTWIDSQDDKAQAAPQHPR